MTMNQLVEQVKKDAAGEIALYGGVYIAIVPNGHYDLEVETAPEQTVGAVWSLDTDNLVRARAEANALAATFARNGVHVYVTRAEWEATRNKEEA